MAIFHCYVSSPEGIPIQWLFYGYTSRYTFHIRSDSPRERWWVQQAGSSWRAWAPRSSAMSCTRHVGYRRMLFGMWQVFKGKDKNRCLRWFGTWLFHLYNRSKNELNGSKWAMVSIAMLVYQRVIWWFGTFQILGISWSLRIIPFGSKYEPLGP